jgi:hypothetical protein
MPKPHRRSRARPIAAGTLRVLVALAAAVVLHAPRAWAQDSTSTTPATSRPPAPAAPARANAHADADRAPAGAIGDTTGFLPHWLRPWFEIGGGWLGGPKYLKPFYQSGQTLVAGLEVRPRARVAIVGSADYQIMIANHNVPLGMFYIGNDGLTAGVDTVNFSYQTSAWRTLALAELGLRPWGDVWLTGGGGGGYMKSGFEGLDSYIRNAPPIVRNGWGWAWTASVRYDFTPAPAAPLGLVARSTQMLRGHDTLQFWKVALCYRVPDLPHDKRRHPPRR